MDEEDRYWAELFDIDHPTYLSDNDIGIWKMRDGRLIKMSEMKLGHLKSSIGYMASRLEQARAEPETASYMRQIENKLLELQSEYDSRDKEIDQMLGIFSALTRAVK